jgi:predicted nucleic acid-binding protein
MQYKVYIETSIISYLTARPSNDLRAAANQQTTNEWWESRRHRFDLYISEFVTMEAVMGNPDAASRRIAVIAGLPSLALTEEVRMLGKTLVERGSLPKKAEIDAYHIAIASVHGMEYLLTWNCAHIANAIMRPKIEAVCRQCGYAPPVICTPQELMEI